MCEQGMPFVLLTETYCYVLYTWRLSLPFTDDVFPVNTIIFTKHESCRYL